MQESIEEESAMEMPGGGPVDSKKRPPTLLNAEFSTAAIMVRSDSGSGSGSSNSRRPPKPWLKSGNDFGMSMPVMPNVHASFSGSFSSRSPRAVKSSTPRPSMRALASSNSSFGASIKAMNPEEFAEEAKLVMERAASGAPVVVPSLATKRTQKNLWGDRPPEIPEWLRRTDRGALLNELYIASAASSSYCDSLLIASSDQRLRHSQAALKPHPGEEPLLTGAPGTAFYAADGRLGLALSGHTKEMLGCAGDMSDSAKFMLAGEPHALERLAGDAANVICTLEGTVGEFVKGSDSVSSQVDRCEAQITHLEEQFRKVGEHSEMFAESVRHRMKVHELLAVDAKRENEFLQSRNRQLEGLLEEAVKRAEGEGEKKSTSRLVEAAEERLQTMAGMLSEAQSVAKHRLDDIVTLQRQLSEMDARYRTKISKLSNWTLNLSASFDDQEVKLEKLREEVRGLHKRIASRDETIAELRGRNWTLKDQASAVARQLAGERKRWADEAAIVLEIGRRQNEEGDGVIEALTAEIKGLKEQLVKRVSDERSARNEAGTAKKLQEEALAKIDRVKTERESMFVKLQDAQKQASNYRGELERCKAKLEGVLGERLRYITETDKLTRTVDTQRFEMQELEEEVQRERDRSEKAELTTSSSVEQSRIDREECNALKAANSSLQARVEALELHRRQVDTQLSAAVQEAERIRRDSSSREAHLKGLMQSMGVANESMETKVLRLEEEGRGIKEALEGLRGERDALEKMLFSSRREVIGLRARGGELERRVHDMGGRLPKAGGATGGGGDGVWGGKMGGGTRRDGGEVEAGEGVGEGSFRTGGSWDEEGDEAEAVQQGRAQMRRGWGSEPVNPSPPLGGWEREREGEKGRGRREGGRGPVGSRPLRHPCASSTALRTPRSHDHHQEHGHAGDSRESGNLRGGWEDSEPARELDDGEAEFFGGGEGRRRQQQLQASSKRGWTHNQFESRSAKGDLRRDSDPVAGGANAMQLDLMLARPPSRPWATAR